MLSVLQKIIDAILPPRCLLCGNVLNSENGLCETCFAKIRFIGQPYCLHCGNPLPVGENLNGCPQCLNGEFDMFRFLRSRIYYENESKALITAFKFHDKTENAATLARLLYAAGHDIWAAGADVLAPVPLHPSRLRYRKYNQAALLCKELRHLTGLPVNYNDLQRHKKTRPQVECSGNVRKNNVKNAFSVKDKAAFCNKRVVLIDDVMTTGSTLKECANVLLKSGALSVDALSIARVVND